MTKNSTQTHLDKNSARILSTVLEYEGSRQDTFDICDTLLLKFGSIKGVLSSSPDELSELGLNPSEINFFKLLNILAKEYYREGINFNLSRFNPLHMKLYLISHYSNLNYEQLIVIMYDMKGNFIKESLLTSGSKDSVYINMRRLMDELISNKAFSVVLAHNHPSGSAHPSLPDKYMSNILQQQLHDFDIKLLEHYVIGTNEVRSIFNPAIL